MADLDLEACWSIGQNTGFDPKAPGLNPASAILSTRNFIELGIHPIAQVNSDFYLNWTEKEYQHRLGIKVLKCTCGDNEP